MNTKEILNQRYIARRDEVLREYEFVPLSSLSRKLSPALIVEVDEQKLVPMFQFSQQGIVYPILELVLPDLRECRSDWDICFWLTTTLSVMLECARPSQDQIRQATCPEDIIHLGMLADEQSTYVTSTPLELLASGKNEQFKAMLNYLLDVDTEDTPTKPLKL